MPVANLAPNVHATGTVCRWPLSLRVDPIAAMLNFELANHPVYDGLELQWFDDEQHGTGMLAFLSRRDGRLVDYYHQPGLRVDPSGYAVRHCRCRWFGRRMRALVTRGSDPFLGLRLGSDVPACCRGGLAQC